MMATGERKYTRSQVVIMLSIAFVLVSAVSYAWNLNVPNNFTGGQTISASAMNSNFDYVESRLGAVKIINGSSGSVLSSSSVSPTNYLTWTFIAPQSGNVLLTGWATAVEEYRTDTTCSYQNMWIGVSTSPTSIGSANYWYRSGTGTGWIQHPFNAQLVMSVTGGTSYTVYINAYRDSTTCTTNYYYVYGAKLTAQFIPTDL